MFGPPGAMTEESLKLASDDDDGAPPLWGVFPRTMLKLLKLQGLGSFHASAIEVYMDNAFDLLANRKVLAVGSRQKRADNCNIVTNKTMITHTGAELKAGGLHPSGCSCRQCFASKQAAREARRALGAAPPPKKGGVPNFRRKSSAASPGAGAAADDDAAAASYQTVGETVWEIASPADIARLSRLIEGERVAHSHDLNARSSRSHCLLRVHLTLMDAGRISKRQFLFVDLAGSERIEKSQVTGARRNEATNINKSLTALARCIKMLSTKTTQHVPWRDSTLTKLLRTSFAGKTCTSVCVNVSSEAAYQDETLCSLRFGERLSSVRTSAAVEASADATEVYGRAEAELRSLRQDLAEMEAAGLGGTFGDDFPESEKKTFLENRSAMEDFKREHADLKAALAEAKATGSSGDIAGLKDKVERKWNQFTNVRDILARQKTIKGFWTEPVTAYTRTVARARELEGDIAKILGAARKKTG